MGQIQNKLPQGYEYGQIQQYTPEQMQLFKNSFSNVGPQSYTSRLAGGDESAFQQMEAPAYRDFNALQGNLASRFSGLGGQGALSSRHTSGFQNEATAAGSNFAMDLQSRRNDMRQQAIRDLHGMSQDLLGNRPFDQFVTEKPVPWYQELGMHAGKEVISQGAKKLWGG